MSDKPPERRERRLVPARLSARLTLTMVVSAIVVFSVLGTALSLAFAFHLRTMAAAGQEMRLAEVAQALELQARELDSYVVSFTEWQEFYEQTVEPDPAFIEAELDPWLPERAGTSGLVWQRADGTVLHSSGDAEDLDALIALAVSGDTSGPVLLPSGPAIVSIRHIVGDPPSAAVGLLATARPVSLEGITASVRIDAVSSRYPDALAGQPGWNRITSPDGYTAAVSDLRNGSLLTLAALAGADGRTAAVVEVSEPDPWLGEGRAWIVVVVPIALGVITAGVGLVLGIVLSRSVGRPLGQFVTYMRDQGYFALQGLRVDEELELDPNLPDEFHELGQVIVDLMTQLRVNQAELIEAGDQAMAAERAFRTVVEESPEVKILVRGGVVEIANPSAAHFFGLHLGDLLRADPRGIFSGIDLFDESDDPLDLTLVGSTASEQPLIARCVVPGQPDRWVEISITPIDEPGGDYVISARNVTEERRLEELREEILSLVSHDLRSPLTVVRGYLDILERQSSGDEPNTAIEGARSAARRMEGLLDDLLNATRAERAFAPAVMRPVSLTEVVAGIVASLRISTESDIRLDAPEDITVLGDAARLEQAVANLVGNAIKHGGSGAGIDVRVAVSGDRARVTVRDSGSGVAPEVAERIFERGVRGDPARGVPGMGLGLYIVRVIAEAHGGSVSLEDHEGPGAWFALELPLATDPDGFSAL